ncbi:MAG: ethanolamine utilization acetate kinase EutQ [Neisseriales bacterium]|nr:MAG: ethanolamine utilization acetate kinase EutQ [Neisseriales bacterium]
MKRLITANTVQQEKAAGHTTIEVSLPECIVTPEARLVAAQVGLKIIETVTTQRTSQSLGTASAQATKFTIPGSDLATIRQAILAQLPASKSWDEQLLNQLIQKTVATAPISASDKQSTLPKIPQHIKHVDAKTVQMGIFDGAGTTNQVGIADVITAEDNSPMAGGFMAWENCFFPWTLNYDEIDLVLEGELHIRHENKTIVGKAGDVLFIPKGSAIEFGSPTAVRFFYVAHPANWQDC